MIRNVVFIVYFSVSKFPEKYKKLIFSFYKNLISIGEMNEGNAIEITRVRAIVKLYLKAMLKRINSEYSNFFTMV